MLGYHGESRRSICQRQLGDGGTSVHTGTPERAGEMDRRVVDGNDEVESFYLRREALHIAVRRNLRRTIRRDTKMLAEFGARGVMRAKLQIDEMRPGAGKTAASSRAGRSRAGAAEYGFCRRSR